MKQKTQTTSIDGTALTKRRRGEGKMSKLNNRETNIKWVFSVVYIVLYIFGKLSHEEIKNVIPYVNNLSFMVIHTLCKWHAVFFAW